MEERRLWGSNLQKFKKTAELLRNIDRLFKIVLYIYYDNWLIKETTQLLIGRNCISTPNTYRERENLDGASLGFAFVAESATARAFWEPRWVVITLPAKDWYSAHLVDDRYAAYVRDARAVCRKTGFETMPQLNWNGGTPKSWSISHQGRSPSLHEWPFRELDFPILTWRG